MFVLLLTSLSFGFLYYSWWMGCSMRLPTTSSLGNRRGTSGAASSAFVKILCLVWMSSCCLPSSSVHKCSFLMIVSLLPWTETGKTHSVAAILKIIFLCSLIKRARVPCLIHIRPGLFWVTRDFQLFSTNSGHSRGRRRILSSSALLARAALSLGMNIITLFPSLWNLLFFTNSTQSHSSLASSLYFLPQSSVSTPFSWQSLPPSSSKQTTFFINLFLRRHLSSTYLLRLRSW